MYEIDYDGSLLEPRRLEFNEEAYVNIYARPPDGTEGSGATVVTGKTQSLRDPKARLP